MLLDKQVEVELHNDMRLRFIQADLPGLPRGSGESDEDLMDILRILLSLSPQPLGNMGYAALQASPV